MSTSPAGGSMPARRGARLLVRCLTAVALAVPGLAVLAPAADASTVFNLSLAGSSGTVLLGSTLYAKDGGALRLSVITSGDTECVQLSGAFSGRQMLAAARGSWVFSLAGGQGDGVRTVTASAFPGVDANGCTGTPTSRSASSPTPCRRRRTPAAGTPETSRSTSPRATTGTGPASTPRR